MSRRWGPNLEAFARALPFEHLLRRRPGEEALARWRTEADAYSALDRPVVALALDCSGPDEHVVDTLASWRLQTWQAVTVLHQGSGPDLARKIEDWFPGSIPLSPAQTPPKGVDWVVPAVAGDLLHPSLAGIVAMQARTGAECVAWDWFTAGRQGRVLTVQARHRGPWRDPIAELGSARRTRAYAIVSARWDNRPGGSGPDPRRALPPDARGVVHPEPLSILVDPARTPAEDRMGRNLWPTTLETGKAGPQPVATASGVSVILLFRDRPELTLAAIDSVLRQRFAGELQLVLVDNQSGESTRRVLQARLDQLPPRTEVTWLRHDAPFNHSRQCNLGAVAATQPVLLFLNNDAVLLDSDALDRLTRFALLPGVATVGGRVVGVDGTTLGGGFLVRRQPGAEYNSPVEEARGASGELSRMTVGNTFACAAVPAQAFMALGGLDDARFPVGYNDVEFCLRAAKAGWGHINLADVRIGHAVGGTRARTDEVAQKLQLRVDHPWLAVRCLHEWSDEPVDLPDVKLPMPQLSGALGGIAIEQAS